MVCEQSACFVVYNTIACMYEQNEWLSAYRDNATDFFVIYALIRLSTDVFYSSQLIVENAERNNENGKSRRKKNRAV